ncbi:MAG TPA: flagellar hook-associated protein FlgK [Kaistiaceae bacterium]|nr:flagellar hook-associated protein FlgK [Kaistiaceae bacterium]
MGLSGALTTSLTGLSVTQKGITTVAGNIANADTAGYTRKVLGQKATAAGGVVIGARPTEVSRALDTLLQRQMVTETAAGSYADLIATYTDRLDQGFGEPGSSSSLDTIYNGFLEAVQALTASPNDYSTQVETLGAARTLASQLNALSDDIQQMRSDAEAGIAEAVDQANATLKQIEHLNTQIVSYSGSTAMPTNLLDERDRYIAQLSQLMDIRVVGGEGGPVSIFTTSGVALFDGTAAQLSFDQHSTMTAQTVYSSDPSERGVGTITLGMGTSSIDLLSSNLIRSGSIAAYVELRDKILPEAQNQLDEIASALALSLSNRETDGTAVTSGAQAGFSIDLADLKAGNTISVSVTDTTSNTTTNYTFVRVDSASSLPLDDSLTADPNDTVIGIDFSGGYAAAAAAIQTALGAGYTVTNPSGTTLEFLDDGAAATTDVNSVSASETITSLTSGGPELPFFMDAGSTTRYYTGSVDGFEQKAGFAGRIAVNASLIANPTLLSTYSTSPATVAGDATRSEFIADRLSEGNNVFQMSGETNGARLFTGSIGDYLREVIDYQGAASQYAAQRAEGQAVVVASLEERFFDESGVEIDQELAKLTTLQTSYAANARVMSTVKEMIDILLQM